MITTAGLAEAIEATAAAWGIPACQTAITDSSGALFTHHFGVADQLRSTPVTGEHLFQIGSISKTFAAIEVLKLVEEGRLDLYAPVSSVLPWLPKVLHDKRITIERLLQHRAGLIMGSDTVPDEAAQAATYSGGVSDAPAGSVFHYSNIGYVLVGLVIAEVTGRRSAECIGDDILAPLGMTASFPEITWENRELHALGHQQLRPDRRWTPRAELTLAPWHALSGADGAISSTAVEMCAMVRMLLTQGKAGVLSSEGFRAMTERTGPEGGERSGYGYGIDVNRQDGGFKVSHSGQMMGYTSMLGADIEAGLGFIVLVNTNTPGVGAIAEVLRQVLRGGEAAAVTPRQWASSEGEVPQLSAAHAGYFTAGPAGPAIMVTSNAAGDERVNATIRLDAGSAAGAEAELLWLEDGVATTTLPESHPFYLRTADDGWTWGPHVLRRNAMSAVEPVDPADPRRALCGHYRSYNDWFSHFCVFLRDGTLVMAMLDMEMPLRRIDELIYGPAEEGVPDRFTFGTPVGGQCLWVDHDGDRFSYTAS